MDFVDSSFNDTLGKAIANKGDLSAGLDAWQNALVTYLAHRLERHGTVEAAWARRARSVAAGWPVANLVPVVEDRSPRAAHLGEPIRNFGVGGYGVYQAVRRLQRMEHGAGSAPYLVLNIYLDDHYRSLDAYRLLRLGNWWRDYHRSLDTSMFHANPWQHVRVEPRTGAVVARENACATPESLYDLCDTEFLLHRFGDDFVVHKLVADQTGDYGYLADYEELATTFGVSFEPRKSRPRHCAPAVGTLCLRRYRPPPDKPQG